MSPLEVPFSRLNRHSVPCCDATRGARASTVRIRCARNGNVSAMLPNWDLSSLPNYPLAAPVEAVDTSELSEEVFFREYVARNRPCLIRRACSQWPALQRWLSRAYLQDVLGDLRVRPHHVPKIESFGLRTREADLRALQQATSALGPETTVRSVLDELFTDDETFLYVDDFLTGPAIEMLDDDLRCGPIRFTFHRHPRAPEALYRRWTLMLYKNSFSDWHFHPFAEAIMCQIRGTKEVLLMPPTRDAWNAIVPIHRATGNVFGCDWSRYPAFSRVRPYRVVTHDGDGLYIPVNWWHAVQARSSGFGITVPLWWPSSVYDLRHAATRYYLRRVLRQSPAAGLQLLGRCLRFVARLA